ncbi:hypothetical protein [Gloeothece verrucosa]|uniref:Uncharacterized protein n=1 Tax=Gloeothece verrucosa (strain PCC 7822) TaxID=497965 RepID=E0UCQ9_GLOV7|nr:hypothetical protein [Gloeothece verrucosa]ADN15253.1 hypothetical protein Cyan7822_3303 [Gloeothece verrucosa PCC 7822]
MQIESTTQETINGTELVLTTVVLNQVSSHCILTRLLINALGRPGVDNDMELVGAGDRWIITWTHPQFTVAQTQALIEKALTPMATKE